VPAPKGKGGAASVPAYAASLWFAAVVGVIGGFATILTNSMGPMLNVYLLTLQLEPTTFVGTRATFFTVPKFTTQSFGRDESRARTARSLKH
jgi:hypothetical protein